MNTQIASVDSSDETRKAKPLRSQIASTISKNGKKWARGLTAQGGRIWYESTPIANIARDVFTEAAVHGIPASGFSLLTPAARKIPASAMRPIISRIRPVFWRDVCSLMELLAQN